MNRAGSTIASVAASAAPYFENPKPVGGSRSFGQEYNVEFDWQYTDTTSLSFFTAVFLPGKAYENAAAFQLGTDTDNDWVWLVGGNVQVLF